MTDRHAAVLWTATLGLLVGCSASSAPPAPAPQAESAVTQPAPALPTPQELIARHIEAVGGEAAVRRYTSSRAVGQLSVPAQGITGDLEVFSQAPNKFLLRAEVPGIGLITAGYDGEVGWSNNPAMGPMVLGGNRLNQMREQADFYGLLSRDQYAISMETLELTEFADKRCYAVKVTTTWDEEYVEYYDADTGLLAGSVRQVESPMGTMEATSILGDYRDFGGLLVPAQTTQRTMGVDQIITVTDVEYDVVDPAMFELPDEIRALVEG